MTIAAWPSTLPQCPILTGWDETPQTNVATFSPEVGPPKYRRRSTAKAWLSDTTWRMTSAQVATFKTFYETTIADGSLPFTWAHPITKVTYNWCFTKQAPKIQRVAPAVHTVDFQLLRLP